MSAVGRPMAAPDDADNPSVGSFLLPAGFRRPGLPALVREGTAPSEVLRHLAGRLGERQARRRTPWTGRAGARVGDPVLLVPGFLAGDASLVAIHRGLRRLGLRTYRSGIHANIGCTLDAGERLEHRLEAVALHRESRVVIVGHSLGGMLARGLAVRRPDLVSGIVTLGSPMLAPGAHHQALSASIDALVRLTRAGVPGLMGEDCVAGVCARASFAECRAPMPPGVSFTSVYSRRDGVVDWRACLDPEAHAVEVTCSHLGMAVDPAVLDAVAGALRQPAYVGRPALAAVPEPGSVLEVDRGESA